MKVLIARTDRLGDVVLTLPMVQALKQARPEAHVAMLLRHYTAPLAKHHPDVDEIILYDEPSGEQKKFGVIRKTLREKKFDVAIVPSPRFRLAFLLREASIPCRIGTGYRWYSSLFTERIYEHRHDARYHEAEYNVRMLRALGIDSETPLPKLFPGKDSTALAKKILSDLGLEVKKFFILHPGTGGSTKTVPLATLVETAKELLKTTESTILVTGSRNELWMAEEIVRCDPRRIKVLPCETDLETFCAVVASACGFIAHGTGPLHIAAALGVPTLGLFSPVISTSIERWGPLGKNVATLKPPLDIQCPTCLGKACPYFDCMGMILPELVAEKIVSLSH